MTSGNTVKLELSWKEFLPVYYGLQNLYQNAQTSNSAAFIEKIIAKVIEQTGLSRNQIYAQVVESLARFPEFDASQNTSVTAAGAATTTAPEETTTERKPRRRARWTKARRLAQAKRAKDLWAKRNKKGKKK